MLGEHHKKVALAGCVYLLVAGIVTTAFAVRGATIMAANETAARSVFESAEGQHIQESQDEAVTQSSHSGEVLDAKMLDTTSIVEPAIEAIGRHALRRVIL